MLLAAEETGLIGAWFEGQAHYARRLPAHIQETTPLLQEAIDWLDLYFSGQVSACPLPLQPKGSPFQLAVWLALQEIPYGTVCSYGALSTKIGKPGAAQAVGAAVGRNPLSVFIPCHRVVGKDGSLTGYAGGLQRKQYLLNLERKE